jgi:hypothetical protein
MFDPIRLDDYAVHFVNRRLTPEEEKEVSAFIKAEKKKREERELRKDNTLKASVHSSGRRIAK